MDIQIEVINIPETKTYSVSYKKVNKYTNRINTKTFKYYYGTKKKIPSEEVIKTVLLQVLLQYNDSILFGTDKRDKNTISPNEIKSQLARKIKNMSRSHKGNLIIHDINNLHYKTQPTPEKQKLNSFSSKSIFKIEESAKTTRILGASFSGKTTLLINELNKLDPKSYDKIILFTESINSTPLKDLNPKLNIQIFSIFVSTIIKLLKDINDSTSNRFKFLVILDDVIELKNKTFSKLILTMRNANISTIVLLQHVKLITPATRNSIHDYYITGLRIPDWDYILRSFLASHLRKELKENGSYQKLAERTHEMINNKLILHYDQRKDEVNYFLR